MPDSTKLSSSTTVARYRTLESAGNRYALGKFIVERFDERYFRPILGSPSRHGFAALAVACLVIETIESFYQGLADTKGKSRQMFRDFFARDTELCVFACEDDWFYRDIRCGILHQSETRGGWRVLRRGPALDVLNKTINATTVLRALQRTVSKYANELQGDDILWINFCKKMNAVCLNSK